MSGAVADAEEKLQRAMQTGIGIADAQAGVATAKRLLAQHGFSTAAAICKRSGRKAQRPKRATRLRRRREKGRT